MWRKSRGSVSLAMSAIVPASSTPVGPAPMMTNVISAARRSGSFSRSARSKATRMRRLKRRGVLQRLQTRRERLPLVMAEIGVSRAGREHQRVIGNAVAVIEQHAFSRRIDAADIGEQRRDFVTVAQQIADRPGDLGCRKRGGRDLIEQRLEQMMVAAIDQRDRRPACRPGDRSSPARRSRRRRSPRDGIWPAEGSWAWLPHINRFDLEM